MLECDKLVINNMKIALALALVPLATCFSDTGAFYASSDIGKFGYIAEFDDVLAATEKWTQAVCAEDELTYFVVKNVARQKVDGTAIAHVHYNKDTQLGLAESCENKVNVVEVDGAQSIEELVGDAKHWIVQEIPSFHAGSHRLGALKKWLSKQKRVDVAESYESIVDEVEADFRKAEQLLEAEDDTVSIMSDGPNNLFTNYQFFTPGIWMTLIISSFLIFILYNALGWVSSLEISYKAFDKQVDYEKKNE